LLKHSKYNFSLRSDNIITSLYFANVGYYVCVHWHIRAFDFVILFHRPQMQKPIGYSGSYADWSALHLLAVSRSSKLQVNGSSYEIIFTVHALLCAYQSLWHAAHNAAKSVAMSCVNIFIQIPWSNC